MSEEANKEPAWSRAATWRAFQQIENLAKISHLTKAAFGQLQAMPDLVDALIHVKAYPEEGDPATAVERAKAEADLAAKELNAGFPLIHAQTVVMLWSYLEAMCRDVVIDWIRNVPSIKTTPAIANIKIRLFEYEALAAEERDHYVFDAIEQALGSSLKGGVNRFESLFDMCGLSGGVPVEIGKALFELQQVRNLMVHRAGIVDRRFLLACPWLPVSVGQPIEISEAQLAQYFASSFRYLKSVIARIGCYFGIDMSRYLDSKERSVSGDTQ